MAPNYKLQLPTPGVGLKTGSAFAPLLAKENQREGGSAGSQQGVMDAR
jgi:hypothetical protein